MKHGLAYVPKDRDREALVLAASIRANIASAGYDKLTVGQSIFLSPRKEKRYADAQMDASEHQVRVTRAVRPVPVGWQPPEGGVRKVGGQGLDILILDCPTRGVDIGVKHAMYQLMSQMKKEGKSLVLISEELPELIGMSDRLLILKDGRQTAEFKRSRELTEAKIIDHMI